MDLLLHYFNEFNEYAKVNPIVAGAISLWGLGVVTWLCRGVPRAIWRFIQHQGTTRLSFTSDNTGTSAQTFASFMRWFQASRWAGWSRSFSILPSERHHRQDDEEDIEDGTVIGVGEGTHFFIYRGWPFWMRHARITEGGNMYQVTYEVSITGFGRSRQRVLDLIEEFRYRPNANKTGIYRFDVHHWSRACDVIKRPLDSVVIAKSIKDDLLNNLQKWMGNREWYESRGLPYKMTCILRGLPGTGKTSLIKALAGHFGMNVCLLNLGQLSDNSLERALTDSPANSLIVIEDFDSAAATKARKALKKERKQQDRQARKKLGAIGVPVAPPLLDDEDDNDDASKYSGLTLSGILNALDGVMSLDGKIIFMTTNIYEALDPALVRKGRVDYTYELPLLTDTEVREYIRVMFPGSEANYAGRFADILGCDLQDLYFAHHDDVHKFVASVPKEVTHEVPRAHPANV